MPRSIFRFFLSLWGYIDVIFFSVHASAKVAKVEVGHLLYMNCCIQLSPYILVCTCVWRGFSFFTLCMSCDVLPSFWCMGAYLPSSKSLLTMTLYMYIPTWRLASKRWQGIASLPKLWQPWCSSIQDEALKQLKWHIFDTLEIPFTGNTRADSDDDGDDGDQ